MSWTAAMPLTELAVNTIRTLSMDGVQAANSGHPGTPMALAPLTYLLWTEEMRYDPKHPDWPDRDRFVLSAGHASMLLYSMLHLSGYDLSLDELKSFRQWGSRTAGHPERGMIPGVEVTTGPLGQGISNAVGLAVAEQMLAARFNRPASAVMDHRTWVICSDGDLMEGVAYEACSLAGHLGLGKLICFYDDNKISIAGSTDLAFTEDVPARFDSMGWQTLSVHDINDLDALRAAIREAKADTSRPTLISVRSVIGFGSPHRAGTKEAHGEPLGVDEVKATKRIYGWPEDETFLVPDEVKALFAEKVEERARSRAEWTSLKERYAGEHPNDAAELNRVFSRELPQDWLSACLGVEDAGKPEATRSSSGRILQALAASIPELVGGSADLDPSTKTYLKTSTNFSKEDRTGRNIQFGIREHGMGSIVNGMAAHGGLRPFGSTFFVFSDYLRPVLRLAALSHLPSVFVFTHDSIGLGEDGPTHQPIEHLASLRAIPGLHVHRPADTRETAECWRAVIERQDGPAVLVLSRQNLPTLERGHAGLGQEDGAYRGGYVLRESTPSAGGGATVTLIATGSEVEVAMAAAAQLEAAGTSARVVSMPCWERFEEQDPTYRRSVLGPDDGVRVSIEAASTFGWCRYLGGRGRAIGIDHFGASAPGPRNMEEFGFRPEHVVQTVKELL
ncbi:MAG: transketolase [Candidatus Eisenbacteria bacterium]